nr:male-specific lethal 3 homolog isoform X1 [Rhipicephalus microplus]
MATTEVAEQPQPEDGSARGVKFKFTEGEKVLCYEPDSSKAKVLYESKVLELVAGKDARGRKMPEYLIHFSGWSSSWDRCVAEEFILPNTLENRKLMKKLAEEAAEKLYQTGKSKKGKVPAILKEPLDRKLRGRNRKERSGSGFSSGEELSAQSDSPEQQSEESEEKDSEEEPEELATEYNIDIPKVLRKTLLDDCYSITVQKKLVHLPCTPDVVDMLEAYLKHYAAKLVMMAAKNAKNNNLRATHLDPSEYEFRFSLCKEAMDGLRTIFSYTLANSLLYNEERAQHKLVTSFCRPIRISRSTTGRQSNEKAMNDSSLLNMAPDVATTVKCRSRKSLHGTPDSKGTSSPRRKRSASPPEKRTSRSVEPPSALNSPAKSTHDDSDTDNLPLAVMITGKSPRRRTASVCSVSSSVSAATSEAAPSTVANKYDCTILPSECLEENPASPALLYGVQHLLRLFVKLPELLQKMAITKTKADYLERFLNGFLQYLAGRHEELFRSSAYRDAEEIMAELEKYKTSDD